MSDAQVSEPKNRAAGERFGRFVLLEPIGRGGMAEVFRAVAHGVEGFQRVFVIKRILKEKSESKDFIDMFVAEARVSALLNHPNIVQIYDFGQIGGSYFITMEYLRGKDLLSVLRQLRATHKQLDPAVAAYIAQQVAIGLHYAHSLNGAGGKPLNIVHRDVSPSNVMLLRAGGVKLLDFGIAKVGESQRMDVDGVSGNGFIRGKLSYLSPEQIRGDAIDARSDVFSLGVCLWEMLTGRRLFFEKSEYNTMKNVLERPVIPPSMQRSDLPTALDYIVVRALERDLSRRYPSALEMADALEGFLAETHFAPGALPRLLDDLFGVDAGIFETQVEGDLLRSWGDLPVVPADEAVPHPLATVPPLAVEGSRARGTRRASPRGPVLWALTGAALAAAVALVVARPAAPPAPGAPVRTPASAPADAVPAPAVAAPVPRAPAAPVAAVSDTIELRIESQPRRAEVLGPKGQLLGLSPLVVALPRGEEPVDITLRKEGFVEAVHRIVPDRDVSAVLSLRRQAKRGAGEQTPPETPPPETGRLETTVSEPVQDEAPVAAPPEAPPAELIEPAQVGNTP